MSVVLGGESCPIRGGGPCRQKVLVYCYPFEEDDSALEDILGSYGDVESIHCRHWEH